MEELGKPNLGDYFPIAKLDLRRVVILFRKMMDLFDKMVDEHMELRRMNDYISTDDFLDILLQLSHQGNSEELDRNLIKHLILVLYKLFNLVRNCETGFGCRRNRDNYKYFGMGNGGITPKPKSFARSPKKTEANIWRGELGEGI
ncbi:geraniol 8-hydroxylase-like [Gossypium australe]|uniref:Geraniol 8-hydroxylase-like n=1 Tax=Gossypium australe TaxID=47621 RepID=A0A5B6VIY0_9ROSI|nr:geraniol 8-hydroxylase-like [Gossypium australe]